MSWKSRSIQKFNENLIRKQKIIVPREIKRIGLVIDNNRKSDYFDVHQIRKEMAKYFGIDRSNVIAMEFVEKNKHSAPDDFWFSESDFSFFGKIKYSNLRDFLNREFDMLINYQIKENLFLNHLNLRSKSSFKVGFASAKLDGLALEFRGNEGMDIHALNQELEKYITILNPN